MKIGILSDTHTKEKKSQKIIDQLLKDGAEFFIHCGDIVKVEVLDQLVRTGKKYIAVYGNNDAHLVNYHDKYNLVQEPYYFKLANTTFKLMHLPFYLNADAEVVLFGHTHEESVEFKMGTLFLNPGEACARNEDNVECSMLQIDDDEFTVTMYTKEKNGKKFDKTTHIFVRQK